MDAVAGALKPSGKFLVEIFTTETLLPMFEPRGWTRVDDLLILEERRWDHERSAVETDWTFIDERGRETHHTWMRVDAFHELTELLRSAGFEGFEATDSNTGEPFAVGARRLTVVATKA